MQFCVFWGCKFAFSGGINLICHFSFVIVFFQSIDNSTLKFSLSFLLLLNLMMESAGGAASPPQIWNSVTFESTLNEFHHLKFVFAIFIGIILFMGCRKRKIKPNPKQPERTPDPATPTPKPMVAPVNLAPQVSCFPFRMNQ